MPARWYTTLRVWNRDRVAVTTYVGLIASEYQALDPQAIQPENKKFYEALGGDLADWTLSKKVRMLDWTQLCMLEIRLVHLLSVDAVRMRLPLARERLREVAGQKDYSAAATIVPPDEDLVGEALRERLKQLVGEFHFRCRIWSQREKSRAGLIWLTFFLLVLVGAPLGYVLSRASAGAVPPKEFGLFPAVLIMGAMGGFGSSYLRMQKMDLRAGNFSSLLELRWGGLLTVIAPFFGAVFAGLLLLLFACNFVQGDAFPKVVPDGDNFTELFIKMYPSSPFERVKLLVWSFVAGFAERLVPNALNRLISDADRTKVD